MGNDKKISYLSRTFSDFRSELQKFTQKYYSNIVKDFQDGAIGQWLMDIVSAVSDDLSFYIDKTFSETQIDTAQERKNIIAIAKNMGVKIPGKKASMCEADLSVNVPIGADGNPDEEYLPVVKKSTQFSSSNGKKFELTNDVDFRSQFSSETGASDRLTVPIRNTNGGIIGYTVTKSVILTSVETKYFKKVLYDKDIVPFMEIILPEPNVVSIESIIVKEGTNYNTIPNSSEFTMPVEYVQKATDGNPTWRYFEVDSLAEDKVFSDYTQNFGNNETLPMVQSVGETLSDDSTTWSVSTIPGKWNIITQKFISEYTPNGYCKITFGSGSSYYVPDTLNETPEQIFISKIINNNNLGKLPLPNQTLFIKYTVGGGADSNVPRGAIRSIVSRDMDMIGMDATKKRAVINSLKIYNTSPSVSGKDAPTNDELRNLIKYNSQAQGRCVTLSDYYNQIMKMPGRYGTPYRVGVNEENNKIIINVLSTDYNGKLTNEIATALIDNISEYISNFTSINDFIVIKPGKIINIQIEMDIQIKKQYNQNEILQNAINKIYDYVSIGSRKMGDSIHISSIQNEILSIPGIENIIEIRAYNIFGDGYSKNRTTQPTINGYYNENNMWVKDNDTTRRQLDLKASNGSIICDNDSMIELKNKNIDIKIRAKQV